MILIMNQQIYLDLIINNMNNIKKLVEIMKELGFEPIEVHVRAMP